MRKFFKISLSIFAAYTILLALILPLIAKSLVVSLLNEKLDATATLQRVWFNPYIFKLTLEGLEIKDAKDTKVIGFETLSINLEPHKILFATIGVKEIAINAPYLHASLDKEKRLNLAGLLHQSDEKIEDKTQESQNPPHIAIASISINNGEFLYDDYSRATPFHFGIDSIGFSLGGLDTKELNTTDASMRLYATLADGGFLDFRSDIESIAPFKAKGSLAFEASKLYTAYRYIQDETKLEVADGALSFGLEYRIDLEDQNATEISNMHLALERLRVKPKNRNGDLLNLQSLRISQGALKPFTQEAFVKEIALEGLKLNLKRDSKGQIDWINYLASGSKEPKTEANSDTNTTATKPWSAKIERFTIAKVSANFEDATVTPKVNTKLDELSATLENITLAGVEAMTYDVAMRLNQKARCEINGRLEHNRLSVKSHFTCRDFDLTHYNPYIDSYTESAYKRFDLRLASAMASLNFDVTAKKQDDGLYLKVSEGSFSLDEVEIQKRSSHAKLTEFKSFVISGVEADTKDKTAHIELLHLSEWQSYLERSKDLKLNLDGLIEAKEEAAVQETPTSAPTEQKPFHITLAHLFLQKSAFEFKDAALSRDVTTRVHGFDLHLYDIDSRPSSTLRYKTSLYLNENGELSADGTIIHTPLEVDGKFALKNISLKDFSPYIEEKMFLKIDDGSIFISGRNSYKKSEKEDKVKLNGYFSLSNLFLTNYKNNSSLLSFNSLKLKDFEFETAPNSLFINEVDLDGFYVNAVIDANKTINFAKLQKSLHEESTTPVKEADISQSGSAFGVKVVKLNVHNGSANFSDYSLPLIFKTNIHDLNGAIYAISNAPGETSYVDIDGEVDRYGSTKLKGSLNAGNPKEFLDLIFNFRNLELSSLSGYSADFAGYKIESGKLFLDLGYKILDSQLQGSNNIVIKSIKLGDEIEDENKSSLPLGFVIALLEDKEGVIDIDMPVEGNVDEPDFKYGALVWKTLKNLVVKAVASPFKFLGSMMGIDAEKLESVDFEAGSIEILPPEKEKLDSVANMLIKRPRLALATQASYDENLDKKAIQSEKLIQRIMQKTGIKEREGAASLIQKDLLEDIYKEQGGNTQKLDELRETLAKEYKEEALKRAYGQALLEQTIALEKVEQSELIELGSMRAQRIKSYLESEHGIDASQLILQEPLQTDELNDKWIKTKLQIEAK